MLDLDSDEQYANYGYVTWVILITTYLKWVMKLHN